MILRNDDEWHQSSVSRAVPALHLLSSHVPVLDALSLELVLPTCLMPGNTS